MAWFAFDCSVAEAGYRLTDPGEVRLPEGIRSEHGEPVWLAEAPPVPGRAGVRLRQPSVDEPLLYRSFAALPLNDPAPIIAFANQWGFLLWGRPLTEKAPPVSQEEPELDGEWEEGSDDEEEDDDEGAAPRPTVGARANTPTRAYAESLDLWRGEIASLAHAVQVHTLIREGDRNALASLLRWETPDYFNDRRFGGGWQFRSSAPAENATHSYFARYSLDKQSVRVEYIQELPWMPVAQSTPSERDDPRLVATLWLDQQITFAIRTATEGGLMFGSNERTGERGFQIRPMDLCAAMWSQFALSVASNFEERACRECGRWFVLVPKDRGKKSFCSDNCKVKNFRARKKLVLELFETGQHTTRSIAESTGTDHETVCMWLGVRESPSRTAKRKRK